MALESSRSLADARYPQIENKSARQFHAYTEADDDDLFKTARVTVEFGEFDAPGRPRSRVMCSRAVKELTMVGRSAGSNNEVRCRPCALGAYYDRKLLGPQP